MIDLFSLGNFNTTQIKNKVKQMKEFSSNENGDDITPDEISKLSPHVFNLQVYFYFIFLQIDNISKYCRAGKYFNLEWIPREDQYLVGNKSMRFWPPFR